MTGIFEVFDFFGLDILSVLVFLLIFAIVFAVLQKTKIFGEERKNINTLVAIVVSLTAVLPHFGGYYDQYVGFDVVEIIGSALPGVSLISVAIIMMLLLIGLFAHDRLYLGVTMPGWIAFISFLLIVIIFGSAANWWYPGFSGWVSDLFGDGALSVVIMILIFGIIIGFITNESDKNKKLGALEGLGFHFNKMFDKK